MIFQTKAPKFVKNNFYNQADIMKLLKENKKAAASGKVLTFIAVEILLGN